MKTKDILILAGVGLAGFALYQYMATPNPYSQYGNMIPPGGTYNGIYNNSGQPRWVNITNGVLNVVNQLGQIVSSLPWDQILNQPANSTGGEPITI